MRLTLATAHASNAMLGTTLLSTTAGHARRVRPGLWTLTLTLRRRVSAATCLACMCPQALWTAASTTRVRLELLTMTTTLLHHASVQIIYALNSSALFLFILVARSLTIDVSAVCTACKCDHLTVDCTALKNLRYFPLGFPTYTRTL